jgi:hypothetical protein
MRIVCSRSVWPAFLKLTKLIAGPKTSGVSLVPVPPYRYRTLGKNPTSLVGVVSFIAAQSLLIQRPVFPVGMNLTFLLLFIIAS